MLKGIFASHAVATVRVCPFEIKDESAYFRGFFGKKDALKLSSSQVFSEKINCNHFLFHILSTLTF